MYNIMVKLISESQQMGLKRILVNRHSTTASNAVKAKMTFDDIPGPPEMTPDEANQIMDGFTEISLTKIAEKLYSKYGPIVKQKIGNFNIVRLYRSDDFETVHKLCRLMNTHTRLTFFELKKHRDERPELYKTGGIMPTYADEWWRNRKTAQKRISPLKEVRLFLPLDDEIIVEFLKMYAVKGEIDDFMRLANRLNLELTYNYLFGSKFNSFSDSGLSPDSLQSKVLESLLSITNMIGYFDRAHYSGRIPDSNLLIELHNHMDFTEKFMVAEIEKVRSGNQSKLCLTNLLMEETEFDEKELATIIDILYAGVDTTAISGSVLLHEIAKNKRVQALVKEEAVKLLPEGSNSELTGEVLNKATYLKAALKESLRLNPIASSLNRVLPESINISGYDIPKNTIVLLEMHTACRLETNYKDATTFKPERWLKSSKEYEDSHPHLQIQFGMGTRSCIGRRRAEQIIQCLMLRIFSEYEVTTDNDDLGIVSTALLKPRKPVKVSFKKLK